MIEDINFPEVKNVAVAIVREKGEQEEDVWNAYLLNLQNQPLKGVLVSTRGYGELKETGEFLKTSQLRHFLDELDGQSFKKIEPVQEKVFALTNEFWVSFYLNNKMYDKKYIFVAESVTEDNLITVPLLNKPGVMIK